MTRRCAICGGKLPDEYEEASVVCGACVDNDTQLAAELGDPEAIAIVEGLGLTYDEEVVAG